MTLTGPLFEATYNAEIVSRLAEQYGDFEERHVSMHATTAAMLRMLNKIERDTNPRRGEVVMVVPNAAGRVWLHTKELYPEGIYRLLSGGLNAGEQPTVALKREVEEETGFVVGIKRCLGIITYELSGIDEESGVDTVAPFVSYIFLTTETAGVPQPIDPGENIAGFRAVQPADLYTTARKLRSITGEYQDWGNFRAVAHEIVAKQLVTA